MNPDQPVTPPAEPTPPPTTFEPAVPAPAPVPAPPVEPPPVAPVVPAPAEPALVMPTAPAAPPPPVMPVAPLAAPAMPATSSPGMPIATSAEAPTGWNWGAFFFGWLWGVFNKVWISLLVFVPLGNIVMPFVLGAKGTQWAWEASAGTESVEQFKARQHKWARAGFIVFIPFLVLIGIIVILATHDSINDSKQEQAVTSSFVADLQSNNAGAAYDLTSNIFQSTTTYASFISEVDALSPKLTGPATITKVPGSFDETSRAVINGHTLEVTVGKEPAGKWAVDALTID